MNHFKSMHKESPGRKKSKKNQTIYYLDTHFESNHKRTVDRKLINKFMKICYFHPGPGFNTFEPLVCHLYVVLVRENIYISG